jgi:DNA-3-methyladenine glycosylase
MYGPPGLAYVYFTYGMHHCVNVVCGEVGEPVAVLIRAIEPTEGLARMFVNRAGTRPRVHPLRDRDLCSGPARLCQALEIDLRLNGLDLTTDSRLWIEPRRGEIGEVANTPRIGVESAGAWAGAPLRWCLAGSAHASR